MSYNPEKQHVNRPMARWFDFNAAVLWNRWFGGNMVKAEPYRPEWLPEGCNTFDRAVADGELIKIVYATHKITGEVKMCMDGSVPYYCEEWPNQ